MSTPKNPFAWIEIYVDDMPRAQKFYESVLNIKMQPAAMPVGMEAEPGSDDHFEMVFFPGDMNAPGVSGSLAKSAMFRPGSSGTLPYFACDDCDVELSRVEAAGGKVVRGKMSIGEYGFCGICIDTEGNTIGLHSMK